MLVIHVKGVIVIDIIEKMTNLLNEQQLSVEWLAIQSGLSKHTTIQLLTRQKKLVPKYTHRFEKVIADCEKNRDR